MPAKPQAQRKRKTTKGPGLPAEYREYLLTGSWLGTGKPDAGKAAQYWKQHGRDLAKYWLQNPDTWRRGNLSPWDGYADPAGPCHRPAGWWLFTSLPEKRRRLDGETILRREAERLGHESDARRLDFWNTFCRKVPVYEPDYEHLYRNGLLTKHEQDWLAQHPKVTADDWPFLFYMEWATETGRTTHIRRTWRCLTPKGKAIERKVRDYWQRLDLSLVLPKGESHLYNIDA